MGYDNRRSRFTYLASGVAAELAPLAIEATRNPTTSDFAQIGTTWINTSTAAVYVLATISGGSATWSTSPASGVGTFTSVDITTGDLDVQAAGSTTTISSGTVNFDNGAGTVLMAGDLTVAGTTTLNGDIDITSASLFDITVTSNTDPAILFETDGGTTETIQVINTQGTAADAIELRAVDGDILINTTNSTDAAAIALTSTAGGITCTAAEPAIFRSTANGASAVIIESTIGGVDILASGAAATEDINITATGSSINVVATEADAAAIVLNASGGGVDITAATNDLDLAATTLGVNISAGEAAADAISLDASNAAGGVTVAAGTGGILVGNQADCTTIDVGDIAPTATRNITIGGGTVVTAAVTDTIDIGPDGATTNANSIKTVNVNTGGVTLGEVLTNVATGAITSGTHTVSIQTGNAAAGTVATNVSTGTGTKTVSVGNADGLTTVNIDAITLINDSIDVATSINTGTSTGTVSIGNAAAGAITVDTAAGISLDAATASNFTVTGAGLDLSLQGVGGAVNMTSTQAENDAIYIEASAANGGVQINAGTGGILIGNEADCTGITLGLIAPTADRTITIGGGTVVTAAVADTINVGTGGATTNVDSEKIVNINTGDLTLGVIEANIGSGAITSGTHTVSIQTGNAAAGTVATNISTGTGTKTVSVGNADGLTTVNVDGITLINDSVDVATSINTGTSTGAVTIGNAAAGNIGIDTAGTVIIDADGVVEINSSAGVIGIGNDADANNINIGTGAAARTITVGNVTGATALALNSGTGGIALASTGAGDITINSDDTFLLDADGVIELNSSAGIISIGNDADAFGINIGTAGARPIAIGNATGVTDISLDAGTGGIDINASGRVSMTPATASVAGVALTVNARVFVATFTGQTTAAAATLDLDITNSYATSGCGVLLTVSHLVTANDSDITLEGVITSTAGHILVHCKNNGAAALDSDVVVTGWILN